MDMHELNFSLLSNGMGMQVGNMVYIPANQQGATQEVEKEDWQRWRVQHLHGGGDRVPCDLRVPCE